MRKAVFKQREGKRNLGFCFLMEVGLASLAYIPTEQLLAWQLPHFCPLPLPNPIPVTVHIYLEPFFSSHLKPLGSVQGWVRVLGPGKGQETLKCSHYVKADT